MASDRAKRILDRMTAQGQTETISRLPATGAKVDRLAIVERQGLEADMHTRKKGYKVTLLNDATAGLTLPPAGGPRTATTIDEGNDRFELAKHPGGPLVAMPIRRIVEEETDNDWIVMEL